MTAKLRKPGRPTKLTPQVQERICGGLVNGGTIEAAAGAAGVDERTFYRWVARGETGEEPYCQFCQAVQKARDEAEQRLLSIIADAAPDTWQAAAWILERSRPQRWGRRNPDVAIQNNVQVNIAESEEWRSLKARIMRVLGSFPDAKAAMVAEFAKVPDEP